MSSNFTLISLAYLGLWTAAISAELPIRAFDLDVEILLGEAVASNHFPKGDSKYLKGTMISLHHGN